MALVLDGGANTIGGLAVGGLPAGTVDAQALASASVVSAKMSGAQSGSAPVFGCRAWCNFDGTVAGTNAPRSGGNVTSITRNATGDYTINFATAMPDANYAWSISCNGNASGMQAGAQLSGTSTAPTLISSSQIRFNTGNTSGGTNVDMSHISVIIFR